MGQTGEHLPGPGLARPLQRGGDAEVKLGATKPAQPVVEGAADELVREAVGEPARGELVDHAAAGGRLERQRQVEVRLRRGPEHVEKGGAVAR